MWFGLARVVHLAALFLFSAKRKEKISLTRTTEEPLDSGKDGVLTTSTVKRFGCWVYERKADLVWEGAPVGFSALAAQQVWYGGAWIYFSYVLVS